MERNATELLVKWKNSVNRKPLVLKGARQVGKTWLMKDFGQRFYTNFIYCNFDENTDLKSIFETNKNPNHRVVVFNFRRKNNTRKNTNYF